MKRISVRAAVVAGLVLLLMPATFVMWRASHALRSAAVDVRNEQEIRLAIHPLTHVSTSDFEIISAPAVFLQAAQFQGHLYVAGPVGLLEYDPSGTLRQQYSVGRELPGSPLVALAPAVLAGSTDAELIMASAHDGLIAFNGQSFRQIYPYDAEVRTITALLPVASGHLLIGTKSRGVLVFDGKRMTPLHATLSQVYVTALTGSETDLWVGTLDRGVLHFHAGATDAFSEPEGLPDAQVHSVAVSGDATYVGTSLGVAAFTGGRFSRVLAPGVFATALLASGHQLYVGSEDQGVLTVSLEGGHGAHAGVSGVQFAEVRQLFASEDCVFAVARSGLYRLEPHAFGWQQALKAGPASLSDRNISALATDGAGRLWIGYFDRGLDILSSDAAQPRHVEDEHVFCVNRILFEGKNGVVDVATANGLVRFDDGGSQQQVLTHMDGLIADHVTDVAPYRDGLALATPAGLTFLDASGASSMYAFNGIVNNHVYALGVSGDKLMAGTLGGLSVLDKGSVAVNYTTASSNLKHNWITAVVPVGEEWMVGTYGAGVLALDRSGHFRSFDKGSGPFEVNPNAMLVTPSFVLAGTLGEGLYLFDRQSGRWSVLLDGLPSSNVTALAAANGFVYIGTDNGLVRIAEQKLHS